MARQFNELIKNFYRLRPYMQEFCLHGYRTREEFEGEKSLGTYDDEKRRVQSYIGEWFVGEWLESGSSNSKKTNYVSIDSRNVEHSPLFRLWKTKSFTDVDITLHFSILDILNSTNEAEFSEIVRKLVEEYLAAFKESLDLDEKTIRLKLNELKEEGVLKSEKRGRKVFYSLDNSFDFEKHSQSQNFINALNFYTETLPCGVVGSFILEKIPPERRRSVFSFKNHYTSQTIDAEIKYKIFEAIGNHAFVRIKHSSKKSKTEIETHCLPLKILSSVESGREYLACYSSRTKRLSSIRIDYIQKIEECGVCTDFTEAQAMLDEASKSIWGVAFPFTTENACKKHVEFTVRIDDESVWQKLVREKRRGKVERLDNNAARFSADLYNVDEIKPWVRTFTSHITTFDFGDAAVNADFEKSLGGMYELYGI